MQSEDIACDSLKLFVSSLAIVCPAKDDAATMQQLVLTSLKSHFGLDSRPTSEDCSLELHASRNLHQRLSSLSSWNLPFYLPPCPTSLQDTPIETREAIVKAFLKGLTNPDEWLYSGQTRCALCCLSALLGVSPTTFLLAESKRTEELGKDAKITQSESASAQEQEPSTSGLGTQVVGEGTNVESREAEADNDWTGFALGTAAAVAGGSLMLLTAGLAAPVLAAIGGAFIGAVPLAGPVIAPVITSSVSVAAITGGLAIYGAHAATAATIDFLGSVEQYGFMDLDAVEEGEVWEKLPDLEVILMHQNSEDSPNPMTETQPSVSVNTPQDTAPLLSDTYPVTSPDPPEKEVFNLPVLPLNLLPSPQRSDSTAIKLAICVSGFVSASSSSELRQPWSETLGSHSGSCDRFILLFDVSILRAVAWTEGRFLKEEALSGGLTMATLAIPTLWPIGLLRLVGGLSSPWSSALRRAKEAGIMLGRQLAKLYEIRSRPTTLLGFSLGARVVFFALVELSRLGVRGAVESVLLMGTPVEAEDANIEEWQAVRTVVAGRLVNAFSPKDLTLSLIHRYKTLDAVSSVAGLAPVVHVQGIENSDVSDLITSHENYEEKTPLILKRLGFC